MRFSRKFHISGSEGLSCDKGANCDHGGGGLVSVYRGWCVTRSVQRGDLLAVAAALAGRVKSLRVMQRPLALRCLSLPLCATIAGLS